MDLWVRKDYTLRILYLWHRLLVKVAWDVGFGRPKIGTTLSVYDM